TCSACTTRSCSSSATGSAIGSPRRSRPASFGTCLPDPVLRGIIVMVRAWQYLFGLPLFAAVVFAAAGENESIGVLGKNRLGNHECRLAHWRTEKRGLYLPVVEYPHRKLGPACLVLVRESSPTIGGDTAINPPDDAKAVIRINFFQGDGPKLKYVML